MANESVSPANNPKELLTLVRDLTRQVRTAQRGTWFPLLVLAVITLGAIPIDRYGPRHPGACRYFPGPDGQVGTVCWSVAPWQLVYWPIALVLAYVAIAGFYMYQSRRRGIGTRIQPYVVVGIVIAVLVTAATLWQLRQPPTPGDAALPLTQLVHQLRSPAAAIGLALLVLAWVEHNRALVWFSLGYLVVVLTPTMWVTGVDRQPGPWDFLPHLLITAGVLLLGSCYFATMRPTAESRAR
jgi:hypothetical protein